MTKDTNQKNRKSNSSSNQDEKKKYIPNYEGDTIELSDTPPRTQIKKETRNTGGRKAQ